MSAIPTTLAIATALTKGYRPLASHPFVRASAPWPCVHMACGTVVEPSLSQIRRATADLCPTCTIHYAIDDYTGQHLGIPLNVVLSHKSADVLSAAAESVVAHTTRLYFFNPSGLNLKKNAGVMQAVRSNRKGLASRNGAVLLMDETMPDERGKVRGTKSVGMSICAQNVESMKRATTLARAGHSVALSITRDSIEVTRAA